jgi:diadenosine tetraphosphate (Ap4A) HIT family hydrolase
MFELHPQLCADTFVVGDLPLCRLLLMNDASYPWFILVPRRPGISEIFELETRDQTQLLRESSALSRVLHTLFNADKLNIGALGNLVPQLHVHHIVRYRSDRAWPQPVWGFAPAEPYSNRVMQGLCSSLAAQLDDLAMADAAALLPPGPAEA